MKNLQVFKFKCMWCGHSWIPRRATPPKVCPVCKRVNWKTGSGPKTAAALENLSKP